MPGEADGIKVGFSEPLHDPKDVIVDIVFVHGLNGHRETTWTKYNVFWPKQILPTDISKARILSWGYDANILHFWNKQSRNELNDHSKLLCSDLAGLRSQVVDRPIIFVAHSLGGIVCENALVLSHMSAEDHIRRIASCARGILFLGTPLEGSDRAKWAKLGQQFAKLVGKDSNQDVVDGLQKDSARLCDLRDKFISFLRARAESGVANNKVEVIVPKTSATIPGYEMQSIPADHVEICKFASKSEPGYQRVFQVLKRWVNMLENPAQAERAPGDVVSMSINEMKGGQATGKHTGNSSMTINYGNV